MRVELRLGASLLKSLLYVGLKVRLFPLRQHETINVSLLISQIACGLLKNEICARPSCVHLEGPNTMLQEVNCTELFTCYFAFLERGFPFFAECLVSNDGALQMGECSLGASTYNLLDIGQYERHLRFKSAK